jgi:hypothetical protein
MAGSDLFDDLVRVLDIELIATRPQLSQQIDQPPPFRLGTVASVSRRLERSGK